ncbi:hypothetical protein HCB45_14175 [Listeria sp. FSL L7-0091]|uniref:hypothetical protein n=1 Tax=Listeria farberi TaxID=2713500 RepID=UPI0016273C0B|nr:hypothetical protein [Listeria farberi]MBC2262706.1 hypothetical protein [Listeria farberi]
MSVSLKLDIATSDKIMLKEIQYEYKTMLDEKSPQTLDVVRKSEFMHELVQSIHRF